MWFQGLGLFAARDLEKHTMVIEYIGQLIRNEVAEMREKIYEKQVIGALVIRLCEYECGLHRFPCVVTGVKFSCEEIFALFI